jgi:hypothetical protein
MSRSRFPVQAAAWAIPGLVLASVALWIFFFFPLMGHDSKYFLVELFDFKRAWLLSRTWTIDFSPTRCLGLPMFANPNSGVWSLFQPLGILLPDWLAYAAGIGILVGCAYRGCLGLCDQLGLSPPWARVLGAGWCLQGWVFSHVMAGHPNFAAFALLPLLLWLLLRRGSSTLSAVALAFWGAQLVYGAGYYIAAIALFSLPLSLAVLLSLARPLAWAGPRAFAGRVLGGAALTALIALPKLLAVAEFRATYPRVISMEAVPFWRALAYSASTLFWPFPYDIKALTGWWYGDWEAVEFLLPGAVWLLVFLWVWRRPGGRTGWRLGAAWLALLVLLGGTLSSGLLAPVFRKLPVLESLHVNPRWNGVILLPFFCLFALTLRTLLGDVGGRRWAIARWALLLACLGAPLAHLDTGRFMVNYRYGQNLDRERGRYAICEEPIFGYQLERFPRGTAVDWLSDRLVDPRCYLASSGCRPGTLLLEEPGGQELQASLERYALDDRATPGNGLRPLAAALEWLAALAFLAVLVPRRVRPHDKPDPAPCG